MDVSHSPLQDAQAICAQQNRCDYRDGRVCPGPGNSSSRLRLRNRIAPAERHLGFWTPEQAFLSSGVNERLGSIVRPSARRSRFKAGQPYRRQPRTIPVLVDSLLTGKSQVLFRHSRLHLQKSAKPRGFSHRIVNKHMGRRIRRRKGQRAAGEFDFDALSSAPSSLICRGGRLAVDATLANRVRSGRKQP